MPTTTQAPNSGATTPTIMAAATSANVSPVPHLLNGNNHQRQTSITSNGGGDTTPQPQPAVATPTSAEVIPNRVLVDHGKDHRNIQINKK